MSNRKPRVSIGVPVYNGEKFIRAALNSIVEQTYSDFELIISDNASTDGTGAICRDYAVRDRRIRYYKNDKNMGLAWNQNQVIRLGVGEYYMTAHHDDLRALEYLEHAVRVLDSNHSVVLCYSKTRDIDEKGKFLPREEVDLNVNAAKPHERFRDIIRMDHLCEPIFGLIRMNVLKQTVLYGNYADSDRVLLAQLCLCGGFYQIPEYLFFRRAHRFQSTAVYPDRYSRSVLFDPRRAGKIILPYFQEFGQFFKIITRSSLPLNERMLCYKAMANWLWEYKKRLQSDLTIALKDALRPYYLAIRNRG